FKKNPTPSLLSKVFKVLDTAAKKNIFHANKAARLKSNLSKLLGKKPIAATVKAKTSPKKKSPRKTQSVV
ncbi:30S ribosomal protein S20, partial [Candidatus Gottesmanbacteria bacterium]|nr:30S ribosomal protein S20 [Candidatus Gottesmanbacteria bacterium]